MPNRILRDWTDSESVNSLSADAERLFVRLIMKADDFGRFHGEPCMVRANLFPRRLNCVREADISRWIAECVKAGLIALYTSDGKACLEICKFGQKPRSAKSKFPDPPADLVCDSQDARNVRASCQHDAPVFECAIRSSNAHAQTGARASPLGDSVEIPAALKAATDFLEAWRDWLEYRKDRRKPVSAHAAKLQLTQCEKWGPVESAKAIRESIRNDWQGLFEPRRDNGKRSNELGQPLGRVAAPPGKYANLKTFKSSAEPDTGSKDTSESKQGTLLDSSGAA